MTRATLAAAVASALVFTGVACHGLLAAAVEPRASSVIETSANTLGANTTSPDTTSPDTTSVNAVGENIAAATMTGASAVTFTGVLDEAGSTDPIRMQATVYFATDPARRPEPQVIVVSADASDTGFIAGALGHGDIVAVVTSTQTAGSSTGLHGLTHLIQDAQHSDTGPFGQLFTNPTPPPPSRINGRNTEGLPDR